MRNVTKQRMMKIIEQKIQGKKNEETCEDGIVTTNNFIAVIDGSTSKSPIQISSDMKNGRYAMMSVSHYIKTIAPDISCEEFCKGITAFFQEIYRKNHFNLSELKDKPIQRITASTAIYSDIRKEIWMIGDCQCLVNGTLHENNKPAELVNAKKRSLFIHRKLQEGASVSDFQENDLGRAYILNDIIDSCMMQNITYSVIDGFPVCMEKVKIIRVHENDEIILATDGYPFLHNSLKESENALQELLDNDPLCISQHLATKALMKGGHSFDDRAYIRFIASE